MIASPAQPTAQVLIIDDDPIIHKAFSQVLGPSRRPALNGQQGPESLRLTAPDATSFRFELSFAFQGQAGLAAVEEALRAENPFSLAFVDMRMPPGWDGIETTARLWKADPDLQVIICSAYLDHSWEELTARLGTSDRLVILKKPFDVIDAFYGPCDGYLTKPVEAERLLGLLKDLHLTGTPP